MAEAVTRVRLSGIAPEERGQLVSGVGLGRPKSQIGEEGLGLDREREQRPRRRAGLETAEEPEIDGRHESVSGGVRRL
jgi:hypothetical protein